MHLTLLSEQRQAFDVPPGIGYFNTANLAPQLHAVRAAGAAALERRGRPWTISEDDWFTGAELLTVRRQAGQSWADAVLAGLDERVAIVSVPNVHWTDGAFVDLAPIAARSRELGARLVVDGSQSVGALPLLVDELRPDFLVTVGYKWLLGPFGVGYLYVAEEHRQGEPLEENWIVRAGSEDFARLVDYRDTYQPGARRPHSPRRTASPPFGAPRCGSRRICTPPTATSRASSGPWRARWRTRDRRARTRRPDRRRSMPGGAQR